MLLRLSAPSAPPAPPSLSCTPQADLAVAVRAHGADDDDDDDDAVLPIWSGRIPEADPEKVKFHSARLGGKTLGEELGECCWAVLC